MSPLLLSWPENNLSAGVSPDRGRDGVFGFHPSLQTGRAASTLHRWLGDGFIAGEQTTPGAPWRIRLTKELQTLMVEQSPAGYVAMPEAMRILGVSRQTIMQRALHGVRGTHEEGSYYILVVKIGRSPNRATHIWKCKADFGTPNRRTSRLQLLGGQLISRHGYNPTGTHSSGSIADSVGRIATIDLGPVRAAIMDQAR
jgi:hypothetical protein